MAADKAANGTVKDMSVVELRRELDKRESAARKLIAKRARLMKRVEALNQAIAALGGKPAGRARAKNSMSLVEALAKLLKGKELGIPEIMAQLPGVGYVSPSPNLRTMVNVSLLKKTHFKRTARGVYTAKA